MIADGRAVPDGSVLQADVCVIGAGAAGIAVARALAEDPTRAIVVLEGGGLAADPADQALYQGPVVGEPMWNYGYAKRLDEVRVRVLGGTTHHWGGFTRPYLGIELEDRPWQPVGGWPLWADDLATWYPAAQALMRLGPYDYDPASWLATLGQTDPLRAGPDLTLAITQKRATDFGFVYRNALANASGIDLFHHANVVNLSATPGGDHVGAVEVATLTGTAFTVEASAVVLACGGIENARLLLASDDVVPAGLGNGHDQVGRWYADHFLAFGGFVASTRPLAELALLQTGGAVRTADDGGEYRVLGMVNVSDDALRREGLPGLHLETLAAEPALGPAQTVGVTDDQVAELLGPTDAVRSIIGFTAFLEPVLDPDSRVRLASQLDALGRPQAELDWRHGAADQDHLRRGLALVGRAMGQFGFGRLQHAGGWLTIGAPTTGGLEGALTAFTVTAEGQVPEAVPMGTTFHHMCTTRMDPDPTQGVVDVDCRVHGVDNLWVAGSSVFPTAPGFFPTLTILALALRLADHLDAEVLT